MAQEQSLEPLEQQALAWLAQRERLAKTSEALRAQGWWISDKLVSIDPMALQEPLRSEVLRRMNQPSP